jgi:SAM-dependent methyltransferase
MHAAPDWYKSFFSGLAVEMWLKAVPAEMTVREVEFLRAKLQVTPPAKLLDVPCGGGRHALGLAELGYHVTGVDLSPAFLDAARANTGNLSIEWHQREMLDLPWTSAFDGAYCCGNSFGYLPDADNVRFVASVARSLKPGARFILDIGVVMEALTSNFLASGSFEIGGIKYSRVFQYDPAAGRIVVEHRFERGEQSERNVMSQRAYTYRELREMLANAGFTEMLGFGGLDDEPFMLGSKRLLLVATKR